VSGKAAADARLTWSSANRSVVTTWLLPAPVRIVIVVVLLVVPVLDRIVRDRLHSDLRPRPDVLADRRKSVVLRIDRVHGTVTPGAAISPILGQLS